MCTVTVVPYRLRTGEEAVRLACNRDEQRSRLAALPPKVRHIGQHRAVWPTDGAANGTWIGATDTGLAMTLLNVTFTSQRSRSSPLRSRGSIIPELLACVSLESALACASRLEPGALAPFRLVLVDDRQLAEVSSHGERLRVLAPQRLTAPRLFTSSALGDDLVLGPRQALFDERLDLLAESPEQQDDFHRHRWSDQPHLSVCMSRPDARTVSYTTITLRAGSVQLVYHADAPDTPAEAFSITLMRGKGGES